MLPLLSNSLFFGQLRHDVSRPVLHHPVDEVEKAAHDAHQRLLLGLTLLDIPQVVTVEYGIAGLS